MQSNEPLKNSNYYNIYNRGINSTSYLKRIPITSISYDFTTLTLTQSQKLLHSV